MRIIGLDTETTGLDWLTGHRIIELAILVYDASHTLTHKVVQRYNPQRPIDPKAQAVHGITFEQVAMCPLFESQAKALSTILNKADVIVAHNGIDFDMPFLNHELARCGAPIVTAPVVDTMVQGRWATPFGKNPNLGELAFACGVDYDTAKAHGAAYDVQVMMECYFKVVNLGSGFFVIPERQKSLIAA